MKDLDYTLELIIGALANKEKIRESCFYANSCKSDLIMDLERVVEEANFTKKQQYIVVKYYYEQYTQEEISQMLGISQQAVLDHIKKIKEKIKKVLNDWRKKDDK